MQAAFRATILSSLIALTACAPMQRPTAAASFGSMPVRYREAIAAQLERTLKDADSARIKCGQPFKAYENNLSGSIRWMGYGVDCEVNAKNSFGAYVGFRPFSFYFSGERIYTPDTTPDRVE